MDQLPGGLFGCFKPQTQHPTQRAQQVLRGFNLPSVAPSARAWLTSVPGQIMAQGSGCVEIIIHGRR